MNLVYKFLPIVALLFGSVFFTQNKVYYVNKIQDEILVTGEGTDKSWQFANNLSDFTYPWDKEVAPKTNFRALWSDTHFYFLFTVEDSEVIHPQNGKGEMDVINADRVEIFFKSDNNSKPYYSLEMDPLGRHLDSEGLFQQKVDFEWNWPKKDFVLKAIKIKGGYSIEGSITLASLRQLGIYKDDGILLAGLYRGEYFKINDKKYGVKWISWVVPQSRNFHIPSSFGILKLNTNE